MIIDTDHHCRDRRRRSLTTERGGRPIGSGNGTGFNGLAGPDAADPIDDSAACRSKQFDGADGVDGAANDCGPAYDFGRTARGRYPGRDFDDVEPALCRDWAGRGASILSWKWARQGARDAWNRHNPLSLLCA